MKSLETVQKWMKAFKIICVILLVICSVGAALLALAAVFGESVMGTLATYGDINIIGLIEDEGINVQFMRTGMIIGLLECACAIVLFGFAVKYLKDELKTGTPFTYEIAKKAKTMAILTLALPIATDIITSVISTAAGIEEEIGFNVNITIALVLFAASAVFKYGADVISSKNEEGTEYEQ